VNKQASGHKDHLETGPFRHDDYLRPSDIYHKGKKISTSEAVKLCEKNLKELKGSK